MKILKFIDRRKNSVEPEKIDRYVSKHKGTNVTLQTLLELKYISRDLSKDDMIRKEMGLSTENPTGTYHITSMGYYCLSNLRLEKEEQLFYAVIGYIFGIISPLIGQGICEILNLMQQ